MKGKPPIYAYESVFAKEMENYLRLRASQGYMCFSEPYFLKTLDSHLLNMTSASEPITPEIVDMWIQSLKVHHNTKMCYVSRFRQFAKYLCNLGYTVYIPEFLKKKKTYVPHIFTAEELQRLFEASDNLSAKQGATYAPVQFPVLIRMLYGCGMRIGEALSLQNKDIDWDENTLFIRNAKGNKDRLIPMSESVVSVCRSYFEMFHPFPKSDDYFFHNKFNQQYPNVWAYMWMRKTLEAANIDHSQENQNSRGIGLHCLRHTFAVNSLSSQSQKGIDRYYSIPILSTYLGHQDIYGTEQYLRMTTEHHSRVVDQATDYTDCIFAGVEL